MRVLCLSGGGFKGAFQVPIIEYLIGRHEYDLILGISVGSINGVLAAQGSIDVMRQFWENIDCNSPMLGIPGFLSLAVHRGKGYYSLNPVRRKLEEHVSLSKLKVPFGAGVVARENGQYYTLLSDTMTSDSDLHDAIIGSSAIAGLMEPISICLGGSKKSIVSDGGHRYVLPDFPQGTTHVDAIFCNPLTPDHHKKAQVDRMLEAAAWAFDIQLDSHTIADFEKLQIMCDAGVLTADVYAPQSTVGSLLTADASTLTQRMYQGNAAISHPIKLRHFSR